MENKTTNKKGLLKASGNLELSTDNSNFFKGIDLEISSSRVSKISNSVFQTAFDEAELQSSFFNAAAQSLIPSHLTKIPGLGETITQTAFNAAELQSSLLKATAQCLIPSHLTKIPGLGETITQTAFNAAELQSSLLKATAQSLIPSHLTKIPGLGKAITQTAFNAAELQSSLLKATAQSLIPSHLTKIPGLGKAITQTAFNAAELQSSLLKATNLIIEPSLFNGMIDTYKSTIFDSGLLKGNIILSESLAVVDELANEIKEQNNSLEHKDSGYYSEEELQFIAQGFENWLKGSISLQDFKLKIKGSLWAFAIVSTIVITSVTHFLNILLIVDDHQIQKGRETLESIEAYLETNVLTYKLYKNLSNAEKLNTFHPVGYTRTDTYLRNGRSKTAPVVTDGLVGQKTLVLMLDRKNNWRKVEVKINGTYFQGWVPESKIIRLKKYN